jgi:hypothetical protein
MTTPVRIQAPPAWANRQVFACETEGDPFVVAFDAQAQAMCTPAQARHLETVGRIPLTRLAIDDSPLADSSANLLGKRAADHATELFVESSAVPRPPVKRSHRKKG